MKNIPQEFSKSIIIEKKYNNVNPKEINKSEIIFDENHLNNNEKNTKNINQKGINKMIRKANLILSYFIQQIVFVIYAAKDPLRNIISNFNDIQSILNAKDDLNTTKLLFFNHIKIHDILYKEEEIIQINYNEYKKGLAYNFYLNLLINENPTIINYSYTIDFIKEVNNERPTKNYEYKIIFHSKCVIDLINNYRQTEEYNYDIDEHALKSIEEENKQMIQKNLNVFYYNKLKYGFNDILERKIDEIYIEIINQLITTKLDDFDFITNIFEQLELIDIDITGKMLEKLRKNLNDKKYIKDFYISRIEDLYDEKRINFYFFLVKYVLKWSIFFDSFPFLLKTKKFFLELLKKQIINLYSERNKCNIEKIEYIIKKLLDSEYYWQIYLNKKNLILKEVLIYYKEYKFETKKEDIKIIEGINIKNNNDNLEKYMLDYDIAKRLNIRKPIINYLYKTKNNEKKSEKQINNDVISLNELEKMISEHEFINIKKANQINLFKFFKDSNNKDYLLKIFDEKDYECFIKFMEQNINENVEQKQLINGNKNIKEKQIDNKQNIEVGNYSKILEEIKSTNYKSNSNINNKKDIISNVNKNKIMNLEAPSPYIKESINNNIIMEFLNKNIILFHIEPHKNNSIIYDKIFLGKYNIEISYEKLMEYKEAYKEAKEKEECAKNFMLFLDYLKQIEYKLKEDFIYKYNLKIKLECNKEIIDNDTNSSPYNITSIYTFYDPIDKSLKRYKDENILIDGINSNNQGFYFLLNDSNSPIYNNLENTESNSTTQIKTLNTMNAINNKNINDKKKKISLINNFRIMDNPLFTQKASSEKIIEFVNIIGKHNIAAEYFIELSNGFYLSGGCDNTLILYDYQFMEKMKIRELNDWPFKVAEKKESRKTNSSKITLLCCTNKNLVTILLDTENLKTNVKEYQLTKKTIVNCIEMKENNIITIGYGGSSYYVDIFDNNSQLDEFNITNKTYRGGIKINDKTVVLTSNDIMPDGENKLIFYNIKSKKISNITEDYSFPVSINNMALISNEKIKNNKVLLVACKRYRKGQKNGILLINPNSGDSRRINNEFYDTDNYEVYCFCQLYLVKNNNNNYNIINEEYKKKIEIKGTDYFFVGGFDLDKRIGIIKLFKIDYDEKIYNTKIEFIQEIILDEEESNFEDFDGPISSINQSKISGHIIVTCYNGNVYLFTPPDIDYYLEDNL